MNQTPPQPPPGKIRYGVRGGHADYWYVWPDPLAWSGAGGGLAVARGRCGDAALLVVGQPVESLPPKEYRALCLQYMSNVNGFCQGRCPSRARRWWWCLGLGPCVLQGDAPQPVKAVKICLLPVKSPPFDKEVQAARHLVEEGLPLRP